MSRHTPGPWTVIPDEFPEHGNISGINVYAEGFPGGAVAKVSTGKCSATGSHTHLPCPGEAEANARLIAAAPDLLEACKRATCVLDELTGIKWDGPGGKARQAYAEEIKTIEAAIAKAGGLSHD